MTDFGSNSTEFTAFGSILVPPGSLPFALLHGESLVACAAWALDAAEVQVIDESVTWGGLAPDPDYTDEQVLLVAHDCLCPATPPAFLAECVRLAQETDVVVAGVLPVTDTVRTVTDGVLGGTVDRDALTQVTSPVVLGPTALAVAERLWPEGPDHLPTDTAEIVSRLAEHVGVHFAQAPAAGRRVADVADVAVLEASTAPTS